MVSSHGTKLHTLRSQIIIFKKSSYILIYYKNFHTLRFSLYKIKYCWNCTFFKWINIHNIKSNVKVFLWLLWVPFFSPKLQLWDNQSFQGEVLQLRSIVCHKHKPKHTKNNFKKYNFFSSIPFFWPVSCTWW